MVVHSNVARTMERDHVQSTGARTEEAIGVYRYEKGRQLNE